MVHRTDVVELVNFGSTLSQKFATLRDLYCASRVRDWMECVAALGEWTVLSWLSRGTGPS